MILAGDIGGTYARFGLFEKTGELKPLAEGKYLCKEASGLVELIWKFFEEQKIGPKSGSPHTILSCCFAIAGPVREGRCQMTNVPWLIDARQISQQVGIPNVFLINDLEAHARGLHLLQSEDLLVLQKGDQQTGNRAMVFAGTGLGEAGIFWDGKQFCPIAGEGGHTDFAPRNELEIALFLYLKKKYGHVSYERVVSGLGLYEIYQFLLEMSIASPSEEVREDMKTRNPTSVIIDFGKHQKDRACLEALHLFFSIYGAEAGNVALKFMAVGGVYIGGGMVTPLVDTVPQSSFLSSFVSKGRFSGLLESMPVSIVKTGKTALLGAATLARK